MCADVLTLKYQACVVQDVLYVYALELVTRDRPTCNRGKQFFSSPSVALL